MQALKYREDIDALRGGRFYWWLLTTPFQSYHDGLKATLEILGNVDPMPFLCGAGRCESFKSSNFLYADDDYFSVFGSRFIAEKVSGDLFQ